VRLFVVHGVSTAAAGTVAALMGAYLLSRWMATMLFEVEPTDPLTFAAVAIALLLVATAAATSLRAAHRTWIRCWRCAPSRDSVESGTLDLPRITADDTDERARYGQARAKRGARRDRSAGFGSESVPLRPVSVDSSGQVFIRVIRGDPRLETRVRLDPSAFALRV